MKTLRQLLISLVFILTVVQGRASMPRVSKLVLNAEVASVNGDLTGAHALLHINGQLVDSISVEDGGFTLDLPEGTVAVLEVCMPGHITKQLVLETTGLTRSQRFTCDILLFPGVGSTERAGRITCDPATGAIMVLRNEEEIGRAAMPVATL